jgi:hypothetical protein
VKDLLGERPKLTDKDVEDYADKLKDENPYIPKDDKGMLDGLHQ